MGHVCGQPAKKLNFPFRLQPSPPPPPKNNVEATKEIFGGGPKKISRRGEVVLFQHCFGGAGGARSLELHS